MQGRTNEFFNFGARKRGWLLTLLLIGWAALLGAQTETATIRGVVKDSTGAPLAKIILWISEMDTNMTVRMVETDAGGYYDAPYLRPGAYKISIQQKGYQTFFQDGIALDPAQIRRIDPVLPAGEPEDTAATHAGVQWLDKETGAVRGLLDEKARWNAAPEVDKAPSAFPQLVTMPGIQGNGDNGLVMSGMSNPNRQSWQIDSIPDDASGGLYVNPNFFEFIQTTGAGAGPDAYRASSLDMISKRGSDGFHGQAYYRRGDSRADSRPYFEPEKDVYRVSEAAGEVGGAVLKERLYFFGGWVYQTNPYSHNVFSNVPTAQERVRDFSQYLNPQTAPNGQVVVIRDPRNNAPFPTNQIPSNRVNSVANIALNNAYYPAPNFGGPNTFFQNFTFVQPFGPYLFRGNWPFGRVDMRLADENHLSFRWMETLISNVAPGTTSELLDSTQKRKYRNLAASDTETVSSRLVNHLTLGYTTDVVLQGEGEGKFSPTTGDSAVNTLGIQGVNINGYSAMGFPTIGVNGLSPLSMVYTGGFKNSTAQNDSILTLEDELAWSKGRHLVRIGAQLTRFNWLLGALPPLTYGAFNFTGMFTGLGFADFLLGLPATSSRILNPKVNDKLHQGAGGAYLTDSFRVSSRFTLDYGVRWDYFGSPRYNDGYMYNWNPANGQVVVAPGTLTAVNDLYPTSIKVVQGDPVPKAKTTNFRPRVSAAYRLTDNLVLRGGYGEFTDGAGFGVNGRINDTNGPYRIDETYFNSYVNGTATYTMPKPFPATPTAGLLSGVQSINALPAKTDEGVIRQYNATVERVVSGLILRASAIGARGVNMNYSLNINKPVASATPLTAARLPYPQFGIATATRTDGSWHYDSVQFQAQKRVGPVIFDSNFTFANNTSDYANTFDPYHVTNHWTRDAADRRMYLSGSAIWVLPVGKGQKFGADMGKIGSGLVSNWTLQAIATFASGQYYSPLFTGPDPANASLGQVTELPDCVGNPTPANRGIAEWFNPKAFSIPPASAGRYGTCGMNILEGYPIRVGHASLAKRIPLLDWLTATLIFQASDVTNTPHFTIPQNNLSNPGAGAFTAASQVDATSPERQGYRQIDVKLRLQW